MQTILDRRAHDTRSVGLIRTIEHTECIIHSGASMINYHSIFKECSRVFEEAEYMYHRHHVPIGFAVFKMNEFIDIEHKELRKMFRLTDRIIMINKQYFLAILPFTPLKNTYLAASRLEKNLSALLCCPVGKIFSCAVGSKKKNNDTKDILRTLFRVVETANQNIVIVE